MEIQYVGEHLTPGIIGRISLYTAFFAAVLAAVFYGLSAGNVLKPKRNGVSRLFYLVHTAGIMAAAFLLFYIIYNQYYEYNYVWKYSSSELPLKYIISCFWAGQEGSFLIWALLQALLGVFVLRRSRTWEPQVMFVISVAQAFILSFLLGVSFGTLSLGDSPFMLLRQSVDNIQESIFVNPNYLLSIIEGNGLNPLLENPWMVIHPPVLFLGYASLLIPYAYTIASLWRRETDQFSPRTIPWVSFALLCLGVGIILGGMWAYESLTFGGFWAWDPVENASLVPWLVLLAGLHLMLIAKKSKYGLISALFFVPFSYVMVIYASFLTRSGILGDTSAHSFAGDGKSIHLVVFIVFFLLLMLILFIRHRKSVSKKGSEQFFTREFWMLIGVIVILLSAFQVLLTTSVPVFNEVFGTKIAPPADREAYYNSWQLPYALFMALAIGVTQFLKYGKNKESEFLRRIFFSLFFAAIISVVFIFLLSLTHIPYILFLFVLFFSLFASMDFLLRFVKESRNIGSIISHIGFVVFLLGVLIAFSGSEIITKKEAADPESFGKKEENQMMIRGRIYQLREHYASYAGFHTRGSESFYQIDFLKKTGSDKYILNFSVFPSVNRNKRMGNVYNPDTKHYLYKDVFTYIMHASIAPSVSDGNLMLMKEMELRKGDTLSFARYRISLDSLQATGLVNGEIGIKSNYSMFSENNETNTFSLSYIIRADGKVEKEDYKMEEAGLIFRLMRLGNQETSSVVVGVFVEQPDYIILKAIEYPYISVVWSGAGILFIGLFISVLQRSKRK